MPHKHILVPIDGSDQAFAATRQAAIMAAALDSKLTIISIIEENPFANSDFYYFGADVNTMQSFFDEASLNASRALAEAQKLAINAGACEVATQLIKAEVLPTAIVNAAQQLQADLIVMGSHGRQGIHKITLGSVAEEVLKLAKLPVLIVKQ